MTSGCCESCSIAQPKPSVRQIPKLLEAHAAKPSAEHLQIGEAFPRFFGQTLTGKSLDLPSAAAGGPAVVVFSFSRAAGKDARAWNEHIANDFPSTVPGYAVIMLESVPKLFRGMAMSGIKSDMPLPAQDRTMVSYRDEGIWRQRLAVSDDTWADVILLGPDSRIRWRSSGAYSDAAYAQLKSEIKKLP